MHDEHLMLMFSLEKYCKDGFTKHNNNMRVCMMIV